MIRLLSRLTPDERVDYGSKSTTLAAVVKLGYDVPPGVAVSRNALATWLAENDIDLTKLEALTRLGLSNLEAALDGISGEVQKITTVLTQRRLTGPIADLILSAVEENLPSGSLAVRSSCTAEDLTATSFAGQYESILDVEPGVQVLDAVAACWLSQYTDRVINYSISRRGLPVVLPSMGVLIQQMVQPDFAGVAFSAGPTKATREMAVVESVPGLGISLVAGEATPWTFEVDKEGIVHRASRPSSEDLPRPANADVSRIAQLTRELEASFGCPQDVEWVLTGSGISVVQSRPISTLPSSPVTGVTSEGRRAPTTASRGYDLLTLYDVLGPTTDMVVARGASYLVSAQSASGAWQVPGQPEWDEVATARVVRLLVDGGISPTSGWLIPQIDGSRIGAGVSVAVDWLVTKCHDDGLPGSDLWDSCIVAQALSRCPATSELAAQLASNIRDIALAGFGTVTDAEWYGPGFHAAAMDLFEMIGDRATATTVALDLLQMQDRDGRFRSDSHRTVQDVPTEWHTSQAISALHRLQVDDYTASIHRAAEWLTSCQNPDGSWGPATNQYANYNVYFTSYALMALLPTLSAADSSVRRGERWLRGRQYRSGSFGDTASSVMALEYLQMRHGSAFTATVSLPILCQLLYGQTSGGENVGDT